MSDLFDEIIFDEESQEENVPLEGEGRKIFTEKSDPEIESLYQRYKKGKLILQPEFQRKYVWDAGKASRLIESVLLEIPLPVVYLFEEKDGTQNVIDGQQRLTSFFSFIDGFFPDKKEFKLTGMTAFKNLNKETFKTIGDDLQEKIQTYPIRTILFKKESDADLQFEIFERLNTGSVALSDQELRNCIYRGDFNDLLKEMAKDADFKYLIGLSAPEKRMKDVELVLRFSGFLFNSHINYKPPIKRFLNHTMEENRSISDTKRKKLLECFKNATSIIRSMLDNHAFKRYYKGDDKNPNGRWEEKRFNVSLFDILMDTFARVDKNQAFRNLDGLREKLIDLMVNDQRFIDSIELSTSSLKAVNARFDIWRKAVSEVLDHDDVQKRLYSYDFRKQLFDQSSICGICGNNILSVDDSAVDHIHMYSQGGTTTPENARITHRYCNWAREKK